MGAIRTLNLYTDAELAQLLEAEEDSLEALKPYNGTVPGALAMNKCTYHIEAILKEVGNRINSRIQQRKTNGSSTL